MKPGKYLLPATMLLLLVSLAAWAKSKSEASVTLSDSVQVAGKQLPPGDYRIRWEGSGSNVQVTFLKNGKDVATASAKMEAKKNPYDSTAVLTKSAPSGTSLLTGIQLKDVELQFQPQAAGGQ